MSRFGYDLTKIERTHVQRFDLCGPWREFLKQHGYVVIKSVLNSEQVEEAKELALNWLEEVSPFRKDDPETWKKLPIMDTTGISSNFGVGQSDFQLYVRTQDAVCKTFEKLWDTEDIITSFDGCVLFRPWKLNSSWKTHAGWFHVDQNALLEGGSGFVCVQGIVNLFDCTEETGGLTVVPKSFKHHEYLCKKFKDNAMGEGQTIRVDEFDEILECKPKLLLCKAGDICLFDSRTIHCSTPGMRLPDSKIPDKWELIRIACLICMTPRNFASEKVLKARIKAYENHIGSSHWPHMFHPRPCFQNAVQWFMKFRSKKGEFKKHAERRFPKNEKVSFLLGERKYNWHLSIPAVAFVAFNILANFY